MDNQITSKKKTCGHQVPLVTLALFAYNQEKYISEAIKGAFNQDYPRLEIILSDDCSTDSTFKIIESLASDYSGFHKIIINRNLTNLGLARHFNNLVANAQGEIVVIAAGDDISLPNRVSKTVDMFAFVPEASFVSFTDSVINGAGIMKSKPRPVRNQITKVDLEAYIDGRTPILSGASRGYRKEVFNVFGSLNPECPTEDTPSLLRGLMIGPALVSTEPGILYRQHGNNLSSPASLHSMKFEAIKKQYLRDAEFAFGASLIDVERMRKIHSWAEKNFRRRSLSSQIFTGSGRLIHRLGRVITSKDFKRKEKIELIWSAILTLIAR